MEKDIQNIHVFQEILSKHISRVRGSGNYMQAKSSKYEPGSYCISQEEEDTFLSLYGLALE